MKAAVAIWFIAAIGLSACASAQQALPESEMRSVMFDCTNGEQLEMRFFPARGMAVLVRNGQHIELPQQRSGSGFIYSNGPNTVRGKGDDLSVEIGRMAPLHCKAR